MPLPTPIETRTVAGLEATAWKIGPAETLRLPAASLDDAGGNASAHPKSPTLLRVHHAEHRAWRSPVVLLPDTRLRAEAYARWPAALGGGLVAELARCGHPVWIVDAAHDLAQVQRLIWGQSPRPAFWIGLGDGAAVLEPAVAEELETRRVAGLVLVDGRRFRARTAGWHALVDRCRRAANRVVPLARRGAWSAPPARRPALRATAALGVTPLPVLALSLPTPIPVADVGPADWSGLTGWLESHRGHSPERTVRIPASVVREILDAA